MLVIKPANDTFTVSGKPEPHYLSFSTRRFQWTTYIADAALFKTEHDADLHLKTFGHSGAGTKLDAAVS